MTLIDAYVYVCEFSASFTISLHFVELCGASQKLISFSESIIRNHQGVRRGERNLNHFATPTNKNQSKSKQTLVEWILQGELQFWHFIYRNCSLTKPKVWLAIISISLAAFSWKQRLCSTKKVVWANEHLMMMMRGYETRMNVTQAVEVARST